jgi:hypothetical protein
MNSDFDLTMYIYILFQYTTFQLFVFNLSLLKRYNRIELLAVTLFKT